MSVSSRYSSTSRNAGAESGPVPVSKAGSFVRRQNALGKRHSSPMGDTYVQLIGKFETNAAQQQQQSAPDAGVQTAAQQCLAVKNDSVVDMMGDGSPVVAELKTNVIIKDEFSLLTDLSQHLAVQYTKPSSSIMISLQHSTCLTLGASSDPCYLLNITAVPSRSHPVEHGRVAQQIKSFLADILGVAVARGIIMFHPMLAQDVAFQEVHEPRKTANKLAPPTLEARRRSGDTSWLSLPADMVNGDSLEDEDKPLMATLAALQGVRAAPSSLSDAERRERRRTMHDPPNIPVIRSKTPDSTTQRKERRKTLNVPPMKPDTTAAAPRSVPWSALQERRKSLQGPPALPTLPSPSLMPQDFGRIAPDLDDGRPSTSRGRSPNSSKPRLDDPSRTGALAAPNGKPARPMSISAETWAYERQVMERRNRAKVGNTTFQRPKTSDGERGRPADWRVAQLLSPPTLHPSNRPASIRSNSDLSQKSQKRSRPLSLPSAGFLSGIKSPKSPEDPQSPLVDGPRMSHNLDGVVIPPVPKMEMASQRPHDRMKKRRSFVTALPQIESIPEIPPIPKIPEVAAVESANNSIEEVPLRKRRSLFKMPFKRPGKSS